MCSSWLGGGQGHCAEENLSCVFKTTPLLPGRCRRKPTNERATALIHASIPSVFARELRKKKSDALPHSVSCIASSPSIWTCAPLKRRQPSQCESCRVTRPRLRMRQNQYVLERRSAHHSHQSRLLPRLLKTGLMLNGLNLDVLLCLYPIS